MSADNSHEGHASVQSYAPEWAPEQYVFESPFLRTPHAPRDAESVGEPAQTAVLYEFDSPFSLDARTGVGVREPQAEGYVQLLADLRDREFERALFELANEAADLRMDRFAGESGDPAIQAAQAESQLREHFNPLIREAETLLDNMAQGVRGYDPLSMTETEMENLLDRYEPVGAQLTPNFENFLGKLFDKVTQVAKGAVNLAKKGVSAVAKLGLGPLLEKLKGLVKPLISRVLNFALDKLPAQIQPVARQLAKRFLGETGEGEAFEAFEEGEGIAAHPGPGYIHHEFDGRVAELLFAEGEAEQAAAVAAYAGEFEQQPMVDMVGDLDRARNRFVAQINQLEQGEDPTPQLEEFLPAALMALQPIIKAVIGIIGRPKVVDFLAKYLAQLISPYIGKDQAMGLSGTLVDHGLRLVGFEAAPEARARIAGNVIASTVEDTVRRVAMQPEYVLKNDTLLRAAVQEAFESAASVNFPDGTLKPELRETSETTGTWVDVPVDGKKYYKKYTFRPEINIAPRVAGSVVTFGGETLASFFQRLGLPANRSVRARVHIYKAIPGTWLSHISRLEKDVPGLGTPHEPSWSQIHPLTPEAAGALLQQPGLAHPVGPRFLSTRHRIAVDQCFYYLEILDRTGRIPHGKRSQVNLTLDFSRNQIREYDFFSEADSQKIAEALKKGLPDGAWKMAKVLLEAGLRTALSGKVGRHVDIIHEAVYPEQAVAALKWIPETIRAWLLEKLLEWLAQSMSEYFQKRAQEFINATLEDADGVTVVVTYANLPWLGTLGKMIRGELAGAATGVLSDLLSVKIPDISIRVMPGFHRRGR